MYRDCVFDVSFVCLALKAEVRNSFITSTTTVRESGRISGHTTRAPPVGFELATNGIQFYAIANLDKTSLKESLEKVTFGHFEETANLILVDTTLVELTLGCFAPRPPPADAPGPTGSSDIFTGKLTY